MGDRIFDRLQSRSEAGEIEDVVLGRLRNHAPEYRLLSEQVEVLAAVHGPTPEFARLAGVAVATTSSVGARSTCTKPFQSWFRRCDQTLCQ